MTSASKKIIQFADIGIADAVAENKTASPAAKNIPVIDLPAAQAKAFFLKAESYCNFDLPPYFVFGTLLASLDKKLTGKSLSNFREVDHSPRDHDDLNHIILNNKDGKYAWRPLELIHPASYVSLVHTITEPSAWQFICTRFREFSQNPKIECVSLPLASLTREKDRAEQVFNWWVEVEQRSIEFALDYGYLIQTDITDCYGAIYTHAIAWALHGKAFAKIKANRDNRSLIGNQIDNGIQDMSHGQTNGIPQGSVLMDFIAEMVLGYADLELSQKITAAGIQDYRILRYRDDYRVFINNTSDGEVIAKLITETMIDLGMKINPAKTFSTNRVISSSIKQDKLFWIGQKRTERSLQKHLLLIHDLAQKFPNSGSLASALNAYHHRLLRFNKTKEAILPLISISLDIALHNPKTYSITAAVLSKLLSMLGGDDQKRAVMQKIEKKFSQIPNIGHLQIWLQRITLIFDKEWNFPEPLCQAVAGQPAAIWNSDWLKGDIASLMDAEKIIDRKKIDALSEIIPVSEVELFMSKIWNY
ncbi:MAG: RNA-directed DNA polymerase [Candidatus Obscuribacterales bacterium]|nr:RNA-directed DNA polymerase [Candidatus Obscuribacterales bacterium]